MDQVHRLCLFTIYDIACLVNYNDITKVHIAKYAPPEHIAFITRRIIISRAHDGARLT